MSVNQLFVNNFFLKVVEQFHLEDDSSNYNDLIMVVMSLVKEEPDFSFQFIFAYNILFKFLVNVKLRVVRDFFIRVFDPYDNTLNISVELRKKIYRYAKFSGFFKELIKLMINP